jgi:hypothetical protein
MKAPVPKQPPEDLTIVSSPIPFAKWGIDIIGPLPTAPGRLKYAVVAVDYFTKWAEAIPLAEITEENVTNFIKRHVVYRFGIPQSLVSDNGTQFNNERTLAFCEKFGIAKNFSAPNHPQSNGQVEAVNKIIKVTLKRRLERLKGRWADELPLVLWAYRTTSRTSTGETPFSLAYGVEAVIPVEIGVPSFRRENYEEGTNDVNLAAEKDLLDEKREYARLRMMAYQQRAARYYNSKTKARRFRSGDLVLRKVFQNTKERGAGVLGANWEGPYRIKEVMRPGTYRLETLEGREQKLPWNAEHLKVYYQ